jgi:hypothetical protein
LIVFTLLGLYLYYYTDFFSKLLKRTIQTETVSKLIGKRLDTEETIDYMAPINKLFKKGLKIVTNKEASIISKNLKSQVEVNTKGSLDNSGYSKDELEIIKQETVHRNMKLIRMCLNAHIKPNRNPFKDSNIVEITREFNPFKRFSHTYFYRLSKSNSIYDEKFQLAYGIDKIVTELTYIFKKQKENLKIVEDFAVEERKDNPKAQLEKFCSAVWVGNTSVSVAVNKALVVDSLKASLTDDIPEFYQHLYKGKPQNYYKTILKNSMKFIMALNYCISENANANDKRYSVFLYVVDFPFQSAKQGDRFRFTSYQIVSVITPNTSLRTFVEGLIEKDTAGTLIRIVVPNECRTCAIISEMANDPVFSKGEAIITPYALFTYKGEDKKLDIKKSNHVKYIQVELDVHPQPASEDEKHWSDLS